MVDGVLASCYAFPHHSLAVTAPFWGISNIIDWIFGQENESTVYREVVEELCKWVLLTYALRSLINYIAF